MIHSLHIEGYRPRLDISLKLEPITVVQAPTLLVLNEPQNSLNPSLFPALAQLIAYATEASQVLVITHSQDLATLLATEQKAHLHNLILKDGATRLLQDAHARKVWRFD